MESLFCNCIHHDFYFLYFVTDIWGPCGPGRDCPSQCEPIPGDSKQLAWGHTSWVHSPLPFPYQLLQSGTLSICPKPTLGQELDDQRQPGSQRRPKLSKRANPEPAYPAHLASPIHFQEKHNKASCPCFPFAPAAPRPTLVLPHRALSGVMGPLLFLGKCESQTILFNGNRLDPFTWLNVNKNKNSGIFSNSIC